MIYENKHETTDVKVCVKLTKTFIFLHISQNEHIIAITTKINEKQRYQADLKLKGT